MYKRQVHVSAKDMGTGKEQSIQITANSGLSDAEIQQMVKDAELHAEDDKKKRELIEARNQLDSLIYSTEKSFSELGAQLSDGDKGSLTAAIEEAKKHLESKELSELKAATEALQKATHALTEQMYKKAAEGAAKDGGSAQGDAGAAAANGGDDVVDADFEEVRDN